MRSSKRGLTLVEVMVTGAVLMIFSTMISKAVVVAFRSQQSSEKKVFALRQGSMTLDRIRREFATTSALFTPNPNSTVTGFVPTLGSPLRFERNIAGGTVEVWYWYDAATEEVRRWEAGEPAAGRVLAREVKSFTIDHVSNSTVLRTTMRVSTVNKPLTLVGRVLSL